MRHYWSVKISIHDMVACKICTQKYMGMWVDAFKLSIYIVLKAEVAHLLDQLRYFGMVGFVLI